MRVRKRDRCAIYTLGPISILGVLLAMFTIDKIQRVEFLPSTYCPQLVAAPFQVMRGRIGTCRIQLTMVPSRFIASHIIKTVGEAHGP